MNERIEITEELVKKIGSLLDKGLVKGLGEARPGEGCVEAMICLALGLPHSDDPICVNQAVRSCKIRINDSRWSSNEKRGQALKKIAILQLNTKDTITNKQFWLALKHELDNTDEQTRKWSAVAADADADAAAYAYAVAADADADADAADADADAILLKFVGCFERALISLNVEGVKWLEFLSE